MLTDAKCRNAACPPDKKRARFTDAQGLYLEVSPAGSKSWFMKLYRDNKETRLALGSYPAVSLAEARKARDVARLQKAQGQDPIQARKQARLCAGASPEDAFEAVALEWYDKQVSEWSAAHASRVKRQLERDLFPWLGSRSLASIRPPELLAALHRVEARGALETAERELQTAGQIWRYGVATGRVERDITPDLKGALTPSRGTHFAAITDPGQFGQLIQAMRHYTGGLIVKTALQLAPLLFVRPNELRGAHWDEIDLEGELWTIPAARMKRRKEGKEHGDPHLVPLSRQAVRLLAILKPYTETAGLVFPGERQRSRPISDNTLRSALISLGYGPEVQTVHGFRASARTILDEVLEFDPLLIEAQLAHVIRDTNGRAYNRTSHIKRRAQMMQAWADYLDQLAAGGASIIPIRKTA